MQITRFVRAPYLIRKALSDLTRFDQPSTFRASSGGATGDAEAAYRNGGRMGSRYNTAFSILGTADMRAWNRTLRKRALACLCGAGMVFQFSSCDLGMVTTSTTLDGREALISLIRGAILTPIDAFITGAVNQAFNNDDD
jgi:hypothetical protein